MFGSRLSMARKPSRTRCWSSAIRMRMAFLSAAIGVPFGIGRDRDGYGHRHATGGGGPEDQPGPDLFGPLLHADQPDPSPVISGPVGIEPSPIVLDVQADLAVGVVELH